MIHIPMNKFSSSAAHIAGRNLSSSESFTWLGEHFQVAPAQLKPELDKLFLAGVNHLFLHGVTYSPADAPFPNQGGENQEQEWPKEWRVGEERHHRIEKRVA